ncbi:MAG: RagB/SusD family nutrient uptake outer membrane protein [Janthinobacterium sp.]|jgi:hypothetical protein
MKNIKFKLLAVIAFTGCIIIFGCKKMIEVDPPINEIIGSEAFNTNTNANAVVVGIYADLGSGSVFAGTESIEILTSLSADELISIANGDHIFSMYFSNAITSRDRVASAWEQSYSFLFRINSAIEGCTASAGITPTLKKLLIAELKYLRAYVYFYLINLYGDVPLATSTDIKVNSVIPRTEVGAVWQQIETDLLEAQINLGNTYIAGNGLTGTSERLRPNAYAATALLARVYLYEKKWELAEKESTKVIEESGTYHLESLNDVFLGTSKEAIWQLQPTTTGFNTLTSNLLVLKASEGVPSGPSSESRPLYLSNNLYDKFEENDLRRVNWTDTSVVIDPFTHDTLGKYPFAYKYKVSQQGLDRTEFYMMLRLSEQFLIRAEARTMLGKFSGSNSAEADINLIRSRAGLNGINITSQIGGMSAILNERKFELFTEGGHRWLDLKRTGQIDVVMNAVAGTKGAGIVWNPFKSLYPIPSLEFVKNPSLRGHQNPGYTEN